MRKIIYLITVLCYLCTTFYSYSRTVNNDSDETNSIIQFQDSLIKNNHNKICVYGYIDYVSEMREISLRAAVAWLRDCRKDSRTVNVLDANVHYRIIISPDGHKEENIKEIEKQEEYINRYPFKYYSPDQKEILKDLLSKNQIVIKYRTGLPEFNRLIIELKVYIPGEEIVRLLTYNYQLCYEKDERQGYVPVDDAMSDCFNEDKISSLYHNTGYFLDEIEYDEFTEEENSHFDW